MGLPLRQETRKEGGGQGPGDKARVATPSGGREWDRKAFMLTEHLLYTRCFQTHRQPESAPFRKGRGEEDGGGALACSRPLSTWAEEHSLSVRQRARWRDALGHRVCEGANR